MESHRGIPRRCFYHTLSDVLSGDRVTVLCLQWNGLHFETPSYCYNIYGYL